jgi:hypothetical protein
MIKYIHITSDGHPTLGVFEGDDLGAFIKEKVGTEQCPWFDVVTQQIYKDGSVLVGHVNDEGHLHGLPINPTATAVFGQILAGDILVMSGTDPKGDYDGDCYSVTDWQTHVVMGTAGILNVRPTPVTPLMGYENFLKTEFQK